jgi:hypothetical protein
MASTDIDGSTIVILSEAEAVRVYEHLCNISANWTFDKLDHQIADKLSRDLNLPPLGQD